MDSLLPTSGISKENNGDPSTTFDDNNLQIRISSDLIIPTETFSVETATRNIGVDESKFFYSKIILHLTTYARSLFRRTNCHKHVVFSLDINFKQRKKTFYCCLYAISSVISS